MLLMTDSLCFGTRLYCVVCGTRYIITQYTTTLSTTRAKPPPIVVVCFLVPFRFSGKLELINCDCGAVYVESRKSERGREKRASFYDKNKYNTEIDKKSEGKRGVVFDCKVK